MSLSADQTRLAPSQSWWAEKPEEFYERAKHEYHTRMVRMKANVSTFDAATNGGRMSQPTRQRGAE